MPALDCSCDAARQGSRHAAEAHDLQSASASWCPARAARPSASRRSNGREHDVFTIPHWTWASHAALEGDADLFIVSDKVGIRAARPAARGTAIDAHGPTRISGARHRRVGAARRGCRSSSSAAVATSPTSDRRRAALRARALAARARGAAGIDANAAAVHPASSPSSPAPTWRPTGSARWRRVGDPLPDGRPMAEPPRWALARDRVRHVGEPIAAVIAETPRAGASTRPSWSTSTTRRCRSMVDAACGACGRLLRNCTTLRRATSASAGRAATRQRCGTPSTAPPTSRV